MCEFKRNRVFERVLLNIDLIRLKLICKSRCNNVYVNTTNGTLQRVCKYDYNGQGIEYQVVFLYFSFAQAFIWVWVYDSFRFLQVQCSFWCSHLREYFYRCLPIGFKTSAFSFSHVASYGGLQWQSYLASWIVIGNWPFYASDLVSGTFFIILFRT